MIKKIGILVTAVMVAISSASFAATVTIKNVGKTAYYYQVGKTTKKINANGSAKFTYSGRTIKVKYGAKKNLKPSKTKSFKAKKLIQINPAKNITTPKK